MATLQELLGGGLPPGLLSPAQQQAAEQRAQNALLTNLGFALLQSSRGQPGQRKPSIGQVIGQAGPVGLQAYQQSFDKTLADALKGIQIEELRKKQQQQEAGRAAMQQAYERMSGLSPQGALAMPGGQAGPTVQRAEMIGQRQPMSQQEVLGLAMNPNIDPEAAKRIVDVAQLSAPKEKKPPASYEEFLLATQNPEFARFLAQKAEQSKQPLEIKMGGGVASQIGPILKENQVAASGAALQIDAADRIISAVNTGKVLSGPLTTPVLRVAQIGNVLGITGKDTNEVIANTRRAVRGLAEMTLQGRKSMRGEGAITESEGKLAERAFSGDIGDLTNDEIKILANASKRAAQFTLGEYNKKLDALEKNPEVSSIVPFFRVNVMPSMPTPEGVTVRKK